MTSDDTTDPTSYAYPGPLAATVAGITYRQLDYWDRTGFVCPSVAPAEGSGSRRYYSARDVLNLAVTKRLITLGVALNQIRDTIGRLRTIPDTDLSTAVIVSDGIRTHVHRTDTLTDALTAWGFVYTAPIGPVWEDTLTELTRQRELAETAMAAQGTSWPFASTRPGTARTCSTTADTPAGSNGVTLDT